LYDKLCGDVEVAKFTVPMLVDLKTKTVVNNEVRAIALAELGSRPVRCKGRIAGRRTRAPPLPR